MLGTAHEYRDVATFGQEHQGKDDVPLVRLEIIQRCVKSTGEAFTAPLAFPVLDVFLFTSFSITNECVDAMIGDADVVTLGIGAGMAVGGDPLLAATGAFALRVGDNIGVGLDDRQGDAGLTAWTVIWGSWLPFSGAIFFGQLPQFLDFWFVELPE